MSVLWSMIPAYSRPLSSHISTGFPIATCNPFYFDDISNFINLCCIAMRYHHNHGGSWMQTVQWSWNLQTLGVALFRLIQLTTEFRINKLCHSISTSAWDLPPIFRVNHFSHRFREIVPFSHRFSPPIFPCPTDFRSYQGTSGCNSRTAPPSARGWKPRSGMVRVPLEISKNHCQVW